MADTPKPSPKEGAAARLFEEAASDPAAHEDRTPPPALADIAAHFPDLEILDVIGAGGMGVVYRARHRRLERLVALKILPRNLARDPAFLERFAREARTLASLDHPGIVRVHDFGVTDGIAYLVMEHVDGANLRQVMAAGHLSPAEALAIVPKICEALQYAHDLGVVHRDIKPENVLLDSKGRVKIADFGLAKIVGKPAGASMLTATGQVMGTFQYMAPEQYQTPQDVDHRADLFSLGVVFYEMLTGQLPVGRFQPPSEAAAMDARIDRIVLHALERERTLRYQRAEEMHTDIAGLSTPGRSPVPGADARRATAAPGRVALLVASLAVPAAIGAFALAHAIWGGVIRGTPSAWHREVLKGIAGGVVAAAGVLFGMVAAVRSATAPPPRVLHKASVGVALVNLLGLILIAVIVGNEVQRHSRVDRGILELVTGPITSRESGEIARGVFRAWARLLEQLPEPPVEPQTIATAYLPAHRESILALTRDDLARAGTFGAPLALAAWPRIVRRTYRIREIERTADPDRVVVTASRPGGGALVFTMVAESGDWWFLVEPVAESRGGGR